MLSARRESATGRLEERQTEVSSPATQTDGGVPWAGFDTGPSEVICGARWVSMELDEGQTGTDCGWRKDRRGDWDEWVTDGRRL